MSNQVKNTNIIIVPKNDVSGIPIPVFHPELCHCCAEGDELCLDRAIGSTDFCHVKWLERTVSELAWKDKNIYTHPAWRISSRDKGDTS
jgi:hypothetical protein